MTKNYVIKLQSVCLEIADFIDNNTEFYTNNMQSALGYGCRALTTYLRKGIQATIDLQEKYIRLFDELEFTKGEMREQAEFLEEVFGDINPYTFNDEIKSAIKKSTQQIVENWNEEIIE